MSGPYVSAELVCTLTVSDLDRAEAFYGRVGFDVTADLGATRHLRAGPISLVIAVADDDQPTPTTVHLEVATAGALEQLRTAWSVAGAELPPPGQGDDATQFTASDPDGNRWMVTAHSVSTPLPTSSEVQDSLEVEAHAGTDQTARATTTPGPDVGIQRPGTGTAADAEPKPDQYWLTVVTTGTCPECGLTATEGGRDGLSLRLRDEAHRWSTMLRTADDETMRQRSDPTRWSALEYGAHVRDALAVLCERVLRSLAESEPELEWWDQDAAIAEGFANESDRDAVAEDLVDNASRLADVLTRVTGDQWERASIRTGGDRFTVELWARYALHEVVHHRVDAEQRLRND